MIFIILFTLNYTAQIKFIIKKSKKKNIYRK